MLGCGIIGCGAAAADMCRAIDMLQETRVAGVFDRVEERAAQLASAHGGRHHRSLEELLSDEAVDIVYVALPHHLLAPTAELALDAEKHVLVEKPMGLTVDAIRSLERSAAARRRVVAPVFELRAAGVFRRARQLVSAGAVGEVKAVRIRTLIDKPGAYWQSGPQGLVNDAWRARHAEAGGGVILMNSIHQLDLVRYITGLVFVSAIADVATLYADVEVEDSAAAVLRLSNGAMGSVVAAAHSPGATSEERIEIDGSLGRIDLPDPSSREAGRLRIFLRRGWRDVEAGQWVDADGEEGDPYAEFLRGFVDAVAGRAEAPACADDAAAAVATVLAIYDAAETARPVVIDAAAVAGSA